MQRVFDIFEKLSGGGSIWRACVAGQFQAQRKIQELAEFSENEFFAIDLKSRQLLLFNVPSRTSQQQMDRGKRLGRSLGSA